MLKVSYSDTAVPAGAPPAQNCPPTSVQARRAPKKLHGERAPGRRHRSGGQRFTRSQFTQRDGLGPQTHTARRAGAPSHSPALEKSRPGRAARQAAGSAGGWGGGGGGGAGGPASAGGGSLGSGRMWVCHRLTSWSRALSTTAGSAGGGMRQRHSPAATARPTPVCQLSAYSFSGQTRAGSPCVRQPKLSRSTACTPRALGRGRLRAPRQAAPGRGAGSSAWAAAARLRARGAHQGQRQHEQQAAGQGQDAAADARGRDRVHPGHRPGEHLRARASARAARARRRGHRRRGGRACMARSVPSRTTGDSLRAARSPATWWKWLRGAGRRQRAPGAPAPLTGGRRACKTAPPPSWCPRSRTPPSPAS